MPYIALPICELQRGWGGVKSNPEVFSKPAYPPKTEDELSALFRIGVSTTNTHLLSTASLQTCIFGWFA